MESVFHHTLEFTPSFLVGKNQEATAAFKTPGGDAEGQEVCVSLAVAKEISIAEVAVHTELDYRQILDVWPGKASSFPVVVAILQRDPNQT